MLKQIYPKWACTENEREKVKINHEIYDEIKDKAEVKLVGLGYGSKKYEVVSNPNNLSNDEIALICDKGNLCFGYRMEGEKFVIYID